MLTRLIKTERLFREDIPNHQKALRFFYEYLYSAMFFLRKDFELKHNSPDQLLYRLEKESSISKEKLNKLKQLFTATRSILFQKETQIYLVKLAQQKICVDSLSGKILYFYFIEKNKEKYENSIREIRSYERMDKQIANQIIREEEDNYKQNQIFLFFEILADLVSTPEFQQVIQEQ
jgi:hypothetical protein